LQKNEGGKGDLHGRKTAREWDKLVEMGTRRWGTRLGVTKGGGETREAAKQATGGGQVGEFRLGLKKREKKGSRRIKGEGGGKESSAKKGYL